MINMLLGIVGAWAVCGGLAYGLVIGSSTAFRPYAEPPTHQLSRFYRDRRHALMATVLGPSGLLGVLLFCAIEGFRRPLWRWRPPEDIWTLYALGDAAQENRASR